LGLEGEVQVLQALLGVGAGDGGPSARAVEFSLLLDALENAARALFRGTRAVAQALRGYAAGAVIEDPSGFASCGRRAMKGNGGGRHFEQGNGGGDLLRIDGELRRESGIRLKASGEGWRKFADGARKLC